MAIKTLAELKALWIDGYTPLEANYSDLFDTIYSKETPHASYSSALTQSVALVTTAYPVIFESADDEYKIYHKTATVTIDIASPAVVNWADHGLSIGAVVMFTVSGGGHLPTGVTAGVPYYIRSTGFTTSAFEISTSLGGAAVNTSNTTSGTITAICQSRFYVEEAGDYLIAMSSIVDTSNNTASLVDLWFDVNGSNVPKSNTQVGITGSGIQQTLAVSIILDLAAGDYVRAFYCGGSTATRLLAVGTQTNPTRPACPSIIMTINKVGGG